MRHLRLVIPTLVLALAVAACGGGDDDGGGGDDTAAAGDAPAAAGEEGSTLGFYQCLRDNGLDVPDPENPDAMVLPGGIDRNDPEQMAVVDDCASQNDLGGDGGGVAMRSEEGGADPEAMIEFAECMRDNGVEDFPDPGPEGGLNMTAVDPDTREFQTAMQECGEFLGGSGPVTR